MSYILEALKKSEQERGHGAVPGIQTVHSSSINYHLEKKSSLPYWLAALVIINLSAVGYYVFTKESQFQENKVIPVQHQDEIVSKNVEASGFHDTPETANTGYEAKTQQGVKAQETVKEIDFVKAEDLPGLDVSNSKNSANYNQAPAPTRNNNVISIHELPLSVKQHIPAMQFSAHVYSSNPSQRSLVINNRFMEEGDSITDGVILSEITGTGAIFTYKDYRFSISVLSGWDIN